MSEPLMTPITVENLSASIDAALEDCCESDANRQFVAAELARLRQIEQIATHTGILRAQEQHNIMISEKDAEIARLRLNSERWEWVEKNAWIDDQNTNEVKWSFDCIDDTDDGAADVVDCVDAAIAAEKAKPSPVA